MQRVLKGVFASIFGLVMVVGGANLVGCNTTEGVGKDVEKAGDGLKDAARDAKD